MIITLLIGSVAAADTTSNTTTSNKQTSSISSTTTPEVQKTQATTHAEYGVADLNITVPQIKGMYNLVVVTGETANYLASQTTIPL